MDASHPLVLITGAGRATGIGFEVARQLGQRGHRVILTARKAQDAQARAAELSAEGIIAEGHAMDITDQDASAKVAALLDERFGRLDILINNAATLGRYDEMASTADLAEVRTNFETTLFCAWAVAQTFLPLLLKSPRAAWSTCPAVPAPMSTGSSGCRPRRPCLSRTPSPRRR
jgi:NAD(P)-dependent dehydrogenase (short-subunit alcohol dehydrogenase family)